MHDPRIGRFFAVDPLEKKYPHLTPYQFSSNNPLGMREIEGLEGVKYSEYNIDGKLIRHIIKLKISVVTVEKLNYQIREDLILSLGKKEGVAKWKEIKENRIESDYSTDAVSEIRTTLNQGYNGSDGKGSKNSKGEIVFFSFDVQELHIDSNNYGSVQKIEEDALYKTGIKSNMLRSKPLELEDGTFLGVLMAPNSYMVNAAAGSARRDNNNLKTRINDGNGLDSTTICHEIGHQFLTPKDGVDEHDLISKYDFDLSGKVIDQILNDALPTDDKIIK